MYGFRKFFSDNQGDEEIIRLYLRHQDLKISEIAAQTGRSQAEIYRILHSNEIQPNRLKTNHENVIRLYRAGWTLQEIASFTGYTTRNLRYILKKTTGELNG